MFSIGRHVIYKYIHATSISTYIRVGVPRLFQTCQDFLFKAVVQKKEPCTGRNNTTGIST